MQEEEDKQVYVCLDINKLSFRESNYGTPGGVIAVFGFTAVYWVINIAMLRTYAMMMNTLSKKKPLLIVTVIFIVIIQKLIRVFIMKESQMLKDFMSQTDNNLVTLGEYYDIKTAGFEPIEGHNYHRIRYKDGSIGYIVKFLRGSITSEYTDTKTGQISIVTKFLNTLMSQGISPRIIISDERAERSKTFKFFQNSLRGNDFDEEFIELCNSTLMYHQTTAEHFARITANYYILTASTGKEKKFLESFIPTVGNDSNASTFRDISVMNKTEILSLVKDMSNITHIDESDLHEKEAGDMVGLGESKVLTITRSGEEEEVNKPYDSFKMQLKGIDFDVAKARGTSRKKKKGDDSAEEFMEYELLGELESLDDKPKLVDLGEPSEPDILDGLIELEELEPLEPEDDLQFKAHSAEMSSTESNVLLLNNIVNEDCKLIVL